MKCNRFALGMTVAGMLALPGSALAGDASVDEQVRLMNARIQALESQLGDAKTQLREAKDELAYADEELDRTALQMQSQEETIRKVKMAEQAEAASGMGFLQSIDVSFAMAASWFWNLNNPGDDQIAYANTGTTVNDVEYVFPQGGLYTENSGAIMRHINLFQPDHNSFSVDYGDVRVQKQASKESRAGFRFDLMFGKQAGILNAANAGEDGFWAEASRGSGGQTTDWYIPFAYIEWAPPIEELVGPEDATYSFRAGRFPTWIGQESLFSNENWFITHSNLYHLLQPINHEGISLSKSHDNWDIGVGVINETSPLNVDANNSKSLTWTIGYNGFYENDGVVDNTFVKLNGLYGSSDGTLGTGGNRDQKEWILDAILGGDIYPFGHRVETYLNATWRNIEQRGNGDPTLTAWGITGAARRHFTDRLTAGFRLGYVNDDGDYINGAFLRDANGMANPGNGCGVLTADPPQCRGQMDIWSSTVNVDYLLTEHLNVRAEVKWDGFRGRNLSQDNVFASDKVDRSADPTSVEDQLVQGSVGDRNNQFLIGTQLIYSF